MPMFTKAIIKGFKQLDVGRYTIIVIFMYSIINQQKNILDHNRLKLAYILFYFAYREIGFCKKPNTHKY